jgi:hypothetical protein
MNLAIAILLLAASAAQAQVSYRDLIRAQRAGSNLATVATSPADVISRQVVSQTPSNAVVVAVRRDGVAQTNVVRFAVMYGAAGVSSNVAARALFDRQVRGLVVQLAAAEGIATNDLIDADMARTEKLLVAADLIRLHRQDLASAIPPATAGAFGTVAGAGIAAALVALRRKRQGA